MPDPVHQTKPYIVGIGGAVRRGSTEQALQIALSAAADAGAAIELFDGAFLSRLPHYGLAEEGEGGAVARFVAALRRVDGVIIASPGYHGGVSGLVKNALDYAEETAGDARVYLDGLPVGLIATAYGWQATGSTLMALRSIVHALRGWPTPLGAAVNCSGGVFQDGACTVEPLAEQLRAVGRQVAQAALRDARVRVMA